MLPLLLNVFDVLYLNISIHGGVKMVIEKALIILVKIKL